MLEVKSLTKNYGKVRGVDDISLCIGEGEIVGFIGPNGAGKSTTMNMITGCLAPTSGRIGADGIDMSADPVALKKMFGYLPEQPPVYRELTVYEYLKTVAKLKKAKSKSDEHIEEIISSFGLSEVKNRVIGNLSKGYMQRVGLAQAFIGFPKYVILDEPTVGLDPLQKKQTLKLIKEMSKNCGILLSSHILSEISYVCNRVIIIDNGKIVKNIEDVDVKKNVYLYDIAGSEKEIKNGLMSVPGVGSVIRKNDKYIVEAEENSIDQIFYKLADMKMPIRELKLYRVDVEQEFINATANDEGRRQSWKRLLKRN
ncbi:MAG: ABC transporter ATP-binding protein [Clostridiales bacterium]|nr:ABC transporter ATP-binding protein [Clostridiales bacterium]